MADLPNNNTTTAIVAIGGSYSDLMELSLDRDWIAVDLVAGQTYEFTLVGNGADPINDPYLELYSPTSTFITFDDDGGPGTSSLLSYTATVTGTFYLDVGTFGSGDTGGYTLAAIGFVVAQDDAFTVDETGTLGVGLNLTNDNGSGVDTDPDSVFLLTAVNGVAGDIGTQVTLASGALLTVNSDGTFSYDTNGAFDGLAAPGSGGTNLTDSDTFTYTVTDGDTATVTITITGTDGNDTVLGTTGVDILEGFDFDDILRGYRGDDTLYGDNGTDRLVGSIGKDTLHGDDGNDLLKGSRGADILIGGAGQDHLIGGADADTFRFTALDQSNASGGRDNIVDFELGVDKFELTGLGFSSVVSGGFTGAGGELKIITGVNTFVLGDVDGDKTADFVIKLKGVVALSGGDFML